VCEWQWLLGTHVAHIAGVQFRAGAAGLGLPLLLLQLQGLLVQLPQVGLQVAWLPWRGRSQEGTLAGGRYRCNH